ncbi:ribosome maturation factor RimP [Intrasporangium sp.]|uniref:ribosome maturation factor RimP n=1 Tax=Intrasporangium sp. TaxID=1925024 RepID=UPI003221ECF8
MSAADQLRQSLGPVVAPLGLVIEDVTVSPAGRRRVVRVLVDTDLAGLDDADETSIVAPLSLDQVSDATHAVSAALEASVLLGEGPYVLEVSSPGVTRPLTTRDQFRRNVGRLVEIRRVAGTVTGRVVAVGTDMVQLAVPGVGKAAAQPVRVGLDDVERGIVQVEFDRGGHDGAEPSDDGPAIEEES